MKIRFSNLVLLLLFNVSVCLLPRVITAKGPVITNKGESSRIINQDTYLSTYLNIICL